VVYVPLGIPCLGCCCAMLGGASGGASNKKMWNDVLGAVGNAKGARKGADLEKKSATELVEVIKTRRYALSFPRRCRRVKGAAGAPVNDDMER
jgi:hypothetical protein